MEMVLTVQTEIVSDIRDPDHPSMTLPRDTARTLLLDGVAPLEASSALAMTTISLVADD